jgi:hypothetical protein
MGHCAQREIVGAIAWVSFNVTLGKLGGCVRYGR